MTSTYADLFENGGFSLRLCKNSCPHVAYSNRFFPSTRKRKNGGNLIGPVWSMRIAGLCRPDFTSSFSKASVFARPHAHKRENGVFENLHSGECF